MYAMIRRYRLAGSSQELFRRIKEEFVPIVRSLPGCKAYHVVDCGGLEQYRSASGKLRSPRGDQPRKRRSGFPGSSLGLIPFPPDKLEGDTVLDLTDRSAI